MHNGIHNIDEVIEHLAEIAICKVGWENSWQKYSMAEELEITVGELEVVAEYLKVDFWN